jgi:hypothetical protein
MIALRQLGGAETKIDLNPPFVVFDNEPDQYCQCDARSTPRPWRDETPEPLHWRITPSLPSGTVSGRNRRRVWKNSACESAARPLFRLFKQIDQRLPMLLNIIYADIHPDGNFAFAHSFEPGGF